MSGLRRALAFLTAWPVAIDEAMEAGELGRAALWFPAVGLAMGGLLWGFHWGLGRVLPPLVVGSLVVTLWVALTGGLHLDGWADCCDGLFAQAPPARRLDILQDPGVGAFAVVGSVLLLMTKVAAVASLVDPRGLLLAPLLGRWLILPIARGPAARPRGLGARLRSELTRRRLLPGLALAIAGSAALGYRGLAAFIVGHLLAWMWGRFARGRIGGHTGDVLGATCELTETVVLLAFVGGLR